MVFLFLFSCEKDEYSDEAQINSEIVDHLSKPYQVSQQNINLSSLPENKSKLDLLFTPEDFREIFSEHPKEIKELVAAIGFPVWESVFDLNLQDSITFQLIPFVKRKSDRVNGVILVKKEEETDELWFSVINADYLASFDNPVFSIKEWKEIYRFNYQALCLANQKLFGSEITHQLNNPTLRTDLDGIQCPKPENNSLGRYTFCGYHTITYDIISWTINWYSGEPPNDITTTTVYETYPMFCPPDGDSGGGGGTFTPFGGDTGGPGDGDPNPPNEDDCNQDGENEEGDEGLEGDSEEDVANCDDDECDGSSTVNPGSIAEDCPNLNCIFEKIKDQSNSDIYCDMLSGFEPEDSSLDLNFAFHFPLAGAASTSRPSDDQVTITFNTAYCDDHQMELAATLFHETIHAHMYKAVFDSGLDIADPNSYTEIFNASLTIPWKYNQEGHAQHDIMVSSFIDDIARSLQQVYGNEYELDYFIYHAIEGLERYGILVGDSYNNMPLSFYKGLHEQIEKEIPSRCGR